jgi:hypothetical protein
MTDQQRNGFKSLPALKHLGELSDVRPTIVIDSREQEPLCFGRLASLRGTLRTGDYSILGVQESFSIERKSLADLIACCMGQNRRRFESELHRLRGYRFKRLVVIGTEDEIIAGDYRSNIKPASVLATVNCFEVRYDIPVVFCSTPAAAAQRIESWCWWFAREMILCRERLMACIAFGRKGDYDGMSSRYKGVNERRKRDEQMNVIRTGELLAARKSPIQIAEALGVSLRSSQRYIREFFKSGSAYPCTLTPQAVAELRITESERLGQVWESGKTTLAKLEARIGSEAERSLDATSHARVIDALVRVSERIARLHGLDVPLRVQQETLLLQIKKVDQKITLSFDREQLKPAWTDVGLRRVPSDDQTPALPPLPGASGEPSNAEVAAATSDPSTNDFGVFSENGNGSDEQ